MTTDRSPAGIYRGQSTYSGGPRLQTGDYATLEEAIARAAAIFGTAFEIVFTDDGGKTWTVMTPGEALP